MSQKDPLHVDNPLWGFHSKSCMTSLQCNVKKIVFALSLWPFVISGVTDRPLPGNLSWISAGLPSARPWV